MDEVAHVRTEPCCEPLITTSKKGCPGDVGKDLGSPEKEARWKRRRKKANTKTKLEQATFWGPLQPLAPLVPQPPGSFQSLASKPRARPSWARSSEERRSRAELRLRAEVPCPPGSGRCGRGTFAARPDAGKTGRTEEPRARLKGLGKV